MNKERVVLILEDLNRKLDLLLEMQDALLKEMQGYRETSTLNPTSSSDGDYYEERAL